MKESSAECIDFVGSLFEVDVVKCDQRSLITIFVSAGIIGTHSNDRHEHEQHIAYSALELFELLEWSRTSKWTNYFERLDRSSYRSNISKAEFIVLSVSVAA